MAKAHWQTTTEVTEPGVQAPAYGCQHSTCENGGVWQSQREATEEEIQAEMNLEGPYGQVFRNQNGPHNVAVFSCDEHTFKNADGTHNLDRMSAPHAQTCPAPDPGCSCG